MRHESGLRDDSTQWNDDELRYMMGGWLDMIEVHDGRMARHD